MKLFRKQKGFTLLEFLFAAMVLVSLSIFCGMVYVAVHFLAKVW